MAPDPDLVFGLDGGGTKTLVAVSDRGGAIHQYQRYLSIDPFAHPDWAGRLESILSDVQRSQPRLAGAVFGMPCFGETEQLANEQRATARRLLPSPQDIINDVEAAFDGALAGTPGVLLLAGTGSMAWAGDAHRSIRCGGWGDLFGDEGSGYWVGREALAETGRVLDGRSPHAGFARDLLDHLGLTPGSLLAWCYGLESRRAAIASLAQFVDARAEAGNEAARTILLSAADALAIHAEACARRLDLPHPLIWSHAGSLFRSRILMDRVVARLGSEPQAPRLPPVGGALLRAARQAGWTIDDMWIEQLGRALADRERSDRAT